MLQPGADPAGRLLTMRGAASELAVSERTIWTLVNCGAIASIRIGKAVRIAPEDLAAYVARNRRGGAR